MKEGEKRVKEGELAVSKEYIALKEQFELLKTELSKLISDRDDLINKVKPNIEAQYYIHIGKKQYRLFLIRNDVLRLRRKIELIQVDLNRGESPDLSKIERDLDIELQKWREEVLALYRKIRHAEYWEKLPELSLDDARELKRLYRELVKKLHPDVNEHLPDNYKHMWDRVLTAFKMGDLEEMQTLALLYVDQKESVAEISTMEQLAADIEHLKEKIKRLLKILAEMQNDFPFNLQDKLEDREWIKTQKEAILKELKEYQAQKQVYSALLKDLLNPHKTIH